MMVVMVKSARQCVLVISMCREVLWKLLTLPTFVAIFGSILRMMSLKFNAWNALHSKKTMGRIVHTNGRIKIAAVDSSYACIKIKINNTTTQLKVHLWLIVYHSKVLNQVKTFATHSKFQEKYVNINVKMLQFQTKVNTINNNNTFNLFYCLFIK